MVAHFLEASVMFQTGTVLEIYAVVFAFLAAMCAAAWISAKKNKIE